MLDKEFDNLFRSKLDGFETEPSANVWANIDGGLRNGNRKKLLTPLLSAAASILVLVTAGLLLMPHHVKNNHHIKDNIAQNNTPVKQDVRVNTASQTVHTKTIKKAVPARQMTALQTTKKHTITVQPQVTGTASNLPAPQQTVATQPAPQMVASVAPIHNNIQSIRHDTVLLAANVAQTDIKPIQPVVPDKQLIASTTPQPQKKHHIHSLGDMLNTVIAAVDKRKDKLIEFTDTDDDESVITGVNLGLLAVKKQN